MRHCTHLEKGFGHYSFAGQSISLRRATQILNFRSVTAASLLQLPIWVYCTSFKNSIQVYNSIEFVPHLLSPSVAVIINKIAKLVRRYDRARNKLAEIGNMQPGTLQENKTVDAPAR